MLSPRPINNSEEHLRIEEGADTSAMLNLQASQSPARGPPRLNRNISFESRELSERISRAESNAEKNEALFRTENQRVNIGGFDKDESCDIRERKINFGNEVNVRFFNRSGSNMSLRGRSQSDNRNVADLSSSLKEFDGRSNNKSCLGKTTSYENLGDLESIAEKMGKPREVMSGRRPRSRGSAFLGPTSTLK